MISSSNGSYTFLSTFSGKALLCPAAVIEALRVFSKSASLGSFILTVVSRSCVFLFGHHLLIVEILILMKVYVQSQGHHYNLLTDPLDLSQVVMKRSRTCTYLYDLSGNLNVLLTYVSHLGKYKPDCPQNMFINN